MSYQVLARKWRPKLFKEVRGQSHITQTLINSIKNNKIAHAYLLTGTRGIGKTTIARIFAKAIRCENLSAEGEPCLKCSSCLAIDAGNSIDYLEVDGASNNSVDDIRELIENVQYLPSSGKYKVYVVDEVHMLTTSAFNALLKTLEEPPEHVVFIFATTDPQKLLGTVLSRCQRFDFKNSTIEDTVKLLSEVADTEGIKFEKEDLLRELAKQGHGSFRDSLSLLDQVISLSESDTITEDTLMLSLGMAKVHSVNHMLNSILAKNKDAVTQTFESVVAENIDLKIFSKQVLDKLYDLLTNLDEAGNIQTTDLDRDVLEAISLIEVMWVYENLSKDLDWALNSFDPEKTCCFSFIKMALREQIVTQQSPNLSVKKKHKVIEKTVETVVEEPKMPATQAQETVEEKESAVEAPVEKVEVKPEIKVEKSWDNFIKYLYEHKGSLAMNVERGNILNSADFNVNARNIKIGFLDDGKIFFDYLQEKENWDELRLAMSKFLEVPEDQLNIHLQIVDDEAVESHNFKTTVDMHEDAEKKLKEEQKDLLLENKYIKDAQNLFQSKIDKIVLNNDK